MAKIYHPGYVTDDVSRGLRTSSIIVSHKVESKWNMKFNTWTTLAFNHRMSIVLGSVCPSLVALGINYLKKEKKARLHSVDIN